MLRNILSKVGIGYRMNRAIQVGGAFGVLKHDYGFNRLLTSGKINVKIEFLLLCIGYNINKLHSKIQREKLQNHLYELKTAWKKVIIRWYLIKYVKNQLNYLKR